jgi:hypothetical protein
MSMKSPSKVANMSPRPFNLNNQDESLREVAFPADDARRNCPKLFAVAMNTMDTNYFEDILKLLCVNENDFIVSMLMKNENATKTKAQQPIYQEIKSIKTSARYFSTRLRTMPDAIFTVKSSRLYLNTSNEEESEIHCSCSFTGNIVFRMIWSELDMSNSLSFAISGLSALSQAKYENNNEMNNNNSDKGKGNDEIMIVPEREVIRTESLPLKKRALVVSTSPEQLEATVKENKQSPPSKKKKLSPVAGQQNTNNDAPAMSPVNNNTNSSALEESNTTTNNNSTTHTSSSAAPTSAPEAAAFSDCRPSSVPSSDSLSDLSNFTPSQPHPPITNTSSSKSPRSTFIPPLPPVSKASIPPLLSPSSITKDFHLQGKKRIEIGFMAFIVDETMTENDLGNVVLANEQTEFFIGEKIFPPIYFNQECRVVFKLNKNFQVKKIKFL